MSSIINAAPKAILHGIEDNSGRIVPREREAIPMHLPIFFGFAERGNSKTHLINNLGIISKIYGSRTMDYTDKYATHVTPFISTVLSRGNSLMFKRIIPPDATTGNASLKLHVTESKLPVYERNEDGTYKVDENGDYIPIPDKEVDGFILSWEISPIAESEMGKLLVETSTPKTTIYPILDFEASSPGGFSGNIGFRLYVPTSSDKSPPDLDLIEEHKALLYRFTMIEKPDMLSSPTVIQTLNGANSVDFTFKENVVDRYGIEKYYTRAILPSYEDSTTPGFSPEYSPIGDIHLYTNNHEDISKLILEAERASLEITGDTNIDLENMEFHEVNYFTGVTVNDIPFSTIEMGIEVKPPKVFVTMNDYDNKYLFKGKDGTTDLETLDKEVHNIMMNGWEVPDDPLSDMATRPFSAIWDSGFGLETTKSLCQALGRRKDVWIVMSTFESDGKELDWAEEESVANVLKTYASGFPESEIAGTPVCRVLVVSGRGMTTDNVWKKPVPLALDLADKVSLFMGAGDGRMREGRGFDASPNNQITMLKELTGLYKTERQRQRDWDAGMVYAQSYDRRSAFYAAVQTVYPDDTSVLNSALNMFIATNAQRVCEYVWKNLTGNSKLTSDQFIERSNDMIIEQTTNKYDNRVIMVPNTFYTAADTARGYSWSCRIHMYASNMKTVGAFTIETQRRDELTA